jgi:hypothetical protein
LVIFTALTNVIPAFEIIFDMYHAHAYFYPHTQVIPHILNFLSHSGDMLIDPNANMPVTNENENGAAASSSSLEKDKDGKEEDSAALDSVAKELSQLLMKSGKCPSKADADKIREIMSRAVAIKERDKNNKQQALLKKEKKEKDDDDEEGGGGGGGKDLGLFEKVLWKQFGNIFDFEQCDFLISFRYKVHHISCKKNIPIYTYHIYI